MSLYRVARLPIERPKRVPWSGHAGVDLQRLERANGQAHHQSALLHAGDDDVRALSVNGKTSTARPTSDLGLDLHRGNETNTDPAQRDPF